MFVSINEYAKKNDLTVTDVLKEIKNGEHQTKESEHETLIFVSDDLADLYHDKPVSSTPNKTENYTQAYGIVWINVIFGWLIFIGGFIAIFVESFQTGVVFCLIGLFTVGFGQILKAGLDSAINIRKIKENLCTK